MRNTDKHHKIAKQTLSHEPFFSWLFWRFWRWQVTGMANARLLIMSDFEQQKNARSAKSERFPSPVQQGVDLCYANT